MGVPHNMSHHKAVVFLKNYQGRKMSWKFHNKHSTSPTKLPSKKRPFDPFVSGFNLQRAYNSSQTGNNSYDEVNDTPCESNQSMDVEEEYGRSPAPFFATDPSPATHFRSGEGIGEIMRFNSEGEEERLEMELNSRFGPAENDDAGDDRARVEEFSSEDIENMWTEFEEESLGPTFRFGNQHPEHPFFLFIQY